MSYQYLNHTADVKFRAEGTTIEEMFLSALDALNETVRGDIKILEQIEKTIEIKGNDIVNLLMKFLEEALFLLDSEDYLVSKVKEIVVDKENFTIKAVLIGDKGENYVYTNDVKAVTYNGMFVKQEAEKWVCEVVLDV